VKSIRLLPVVIFAAMALLLFKGIGIVTNGGYVLTGPVVVAAEGDTMALPSETIAGDTSPVMADPSPSLPMKSDIPSVAPPSSAASASSEHGASSVAAAPASSSAAPASESSSAPGASSAADSSASRLADACPDASPSAVKAAAATPAPAPATGGDLNDTIGNALVTGCPTVTNPVNENGDALPTTKDANGHVVPLQFVEGDNSQQALLSRLGERSTSLDKRQADLDMREAIVAAAEKRLSDQTQALTDLQAQVNALVDQKQAAEDASFKAIVSMYEQMKPKDAAKIFDTLDLGVLVKIARAMNPRNMSPILAAMSSAPAQQLTTELASVKPQTTVPATSVATANLPQIVGH
jgi:flagellar motility protein MotE (MotC chaperone)